MSQWKLIYESFEPGQEGLREALCTLGNGYFATRGAAEEAEADEVHYPGTYLAGGYNRLQTDVAGRVIENEDLVNLPNWLFLSFRPEGSDWFSLRRLEVLAYRQEQRAAWCLDAALAILAVAASQALWVTDRPAPPPLAGLLDDVRSVSPPIEELASREVGPELERLTAAFQAAALTGTTR